MRRRNFLKNGMALGFGGAVGLLGRARSLAQSTSDDYRALVCVFLAGGMDNYDTLIPYDQSSYSEWAGHRATLLSSYAGTRHRDQLLALSTTVADGRQFALPPEMSGLRSLYEAGNAAVIANVGPLLEPTNRARFLSGGGRLPARLFSHNDQQATWMSGRPEGAQLGWGGAFADAALAQGANQQPPYTSITSGEQALFLTGRRSFPYQVGEEGGGEIHLLEEFDDPVALDRLRAHLRATGPARQGLIRRDVASALRGAFDANEGYRAAVAQISPLATEFPGSGLGSQLRAVARTIQARGALGVTRQVFIVTQGGYDTHSAQAASMPRLQGTLDAGISTFFAAMTELGLESKVTLFTASDFGRTLAINGDGTDHGWGGHHFVIGGAVQGGRIFGDVPPTTLDHDLDAGSGRLIPSLSVEQMAAPLGRWFGLSDAELSVALPQLGAFDGQPALFG